MSWLDEYIVLENGRVRLEPLQEKHFEVLSGIAQQNELWAFTSVKVNSPEDFRRYFEEALTEKSNQQSYPFAIFDKHYNRYGGCTALAT